MTLIGQVRAVRVLCEVAAQGSFSAAARSLGMTQSAVSQHVAALERESGLPLVERGTRPLELTEAGVVLVRHGRPVTTQLELAEQALAQISGRRAGRLRLGSFPTALTTFVPGALARLRERDPASCSPSSTTTCRGCCRGWSGGELDLAVVYENPALGDAPGRLDADPAFDDPYRVLLPAGHRLARRRSPLGCPTSRTRRGSGGGPVARGSGSCGTPAGPPGSSRARCSRPTTTGRCRPSSPPGWVSPSSPASPPSHPLAGVVVRDLVDQVPTRRIAVARRARRAGGAAGAGDDRDPARASPARSVDGTRRHHLAHDALELPLGSSQPARGEAGRRRRPRTLRSTARSARPVRPAPVRQVLAGRSSSVASRSSRAALALVLGHARPHRRHRAGSRAAGPPVGAATPGQRRPARGWCCTPTPASRRRGGRRGAARRATPSCRSRSAARRARRAGVRGLRRRVVAALAAGHPCPSWRAQHPDGLVERGHRSSKATPASVVVGRRGAGPTPSTSRPPESTSSAAAAFASAAGPRTTGSATVVARARSPLASTTLASATIPSSHGRWKARWSLADRAPNPSRPAVRAY